jgi:SAM-dependent methyltransferase
VDHIYCSHVLEHFTREEGARLLQECARVLREGGTLRVVVPDLARVVAAYDDGSMDAREFVRSLDVLAVDDRDGALKRRLAPLVRYPHKCMYDEASLVRALDEVGLRLVVDRSMKTSFPELAEIEDQRVRTSAIVEVYKPAQRSVRGTCVPRP